MNTTACNNSVNIMTITHLKEETKVNNRDEVNSACIRGNMKLNVTFLTYI